MLFLIYTSIIYSQQFKYDKNKINEAYKFYKEKNYNKSIELLEYEIQKTPVVRIENYEMLANAYMYIKDYTNMLRVSREGIIINRFSPKLYFQKGYALYKIGETNKAIESIRRSLELKPNDAYVNNFLGLLYLYIEDYELAEAAFLKANIYSPNNIVYMANLAASYERDKDYHSALKLYKDVYKINNKYRNVDESINRINAILGYTNQYEITEVNKVNEEYKYNEDIEVIPIIETNIQLINTNEVITNDIENNISTNSQE